MLKQVTALTLVLAMSAESFASGSCSGDRAETEKECSSDKYKDITKKTTDLQSFVNNCAATGVGASPAAATPGAVSSLAIPSACTGDSMREGITKLNHAKSLSDEYHEKCSQARGDCVSSCKQAQTNPTTQAEGTSGEQYCEGEPKENEEASKGNSDALMGALAQLLAAMMAKGQEPPPAAVASVCGQQQAVPPGTTLPPGAATAAATAAQICPTLDKQSTADSTFTNGTGRTSSSGEYLGAGDLGSGTPAAGTPAQVQYSAGVPGGGAGGGMGAGASGSGSRDPGKKGTNGEPEQGKLGLAAVGGGGGGGGGSLAGTGKSGASGAAGAPSRTPVDGSDKSMQAAIDRAVQQRGIASDGPAGGISGANSFDNFQKVEKRMQSERNNLNEL